MIKARGGDDRVKGRAAGIDSREGAAAIDSGEGAAADRLLGGRGADRLNAVDGRRDRVVRGGPGKDVCRIDAADRATVKGCETREGSRRAGGPGGGPGTARRPPDGVPN